MISPRAEAEASQRAASNPVVSAFVAASAGSGKTRLLTDRLLRLMVGGAKPERIFCLTFTKAGAAEMALRLRDRLGKWVTMEQSALERELLSLAIDPNETSMHRARALFAQVLDLPGGMRIETIHAFCQSLLRRFPLEARLSPHFQLMDDRDAEEAIANAREELLAAARSRGLDPALRAVAGFLNLHDFSKLVETLKNGRGRWKVALGAGYDMTAARRRVLNVTAADRDEVVAGAVAWPEETALRDAARVVVERGSPGAITRATKMLDWLSLSPPDRTEHWPAWCGLFLKKDGDPNAPSTFVNDALAKKQSDLRTRFVTEADRILKIEDQARAADIAGLTQLFCDLAGPMLDSYETRKEASGLLEYDDLISRGTNLLVDPGADWVLYKLDGGLDHLLLDEVQDIAPEQWEIAHSLTQEFFAGVGAREGPRTVFAVGDRKQSIFSFQGADVAGFERARDQLRGRVEGSEQAWVDKELHVSFRSTPPVLELVDAVFADPQTAAGVTEPGRPLVHRSDRAGQAGRVELWPLVDVPEEEAPDPWSAPEQNRIGTSAIQILADRIARWIKSQTSGGTRPLRPSDIMILVRRRDALPAAIVRSLKLLDVPVAGLDRMVLTTQPAVQDLVALGDALLLPQDDLTFACVLTSPLGGLNDDDLMALAIGRTGPLSEELRNRHKESPAWEAAWSLFSTLLARADYVSPHALFTEALGALGGRAKLMARLGLEVAEPIDEFLNAALSYVKIHPPSLQGFLRWVRLSGAEIKREPEAVGDQVRILTVHGAKGLQAPVVILPDTTGLPDNSRDSLLRGEDPVTGIAVPIWTPRAAFHCEATKRIRDQARRLRREEYNRLLYVALTRAEDRLVICGTKPKRGTPDESCWYNAVARGFDRLDHVVEDGVAFYESAQVAGIGGPTGTPAAGDAVPPPPFLGLPPDSEPPHPMPFAPSRPEGVELGPVPASASPLARAGTSRFKRGQLIHALLQHLPALPDTDRHGAALKYLERPGNDLSPAAAREIADETMAILNHPALSDAFAQGSRAEVPLTGMVGDFVVGGLVDRIAVLPDRVLLVDFKTNRRPPDSVEATPVTYLRQMASYRAVLRDIFPGRRVECALIWTREARVALLPEYMLDRHTPDGSGGVLPAVTTDA